MAVVLLYELGEGAPEEALKADGGSLGQLALALMQVGACRGCRLPALALMQVSASRGCRLLALADAGGGAGVQGQLALIFMRAGAGCCVQVAAKRVVLCVQDDVWCRMLCAVCRML